VDGTPFGRYRLLELLGRGGMGEVWRAFDTATDRVVAVKLLPAQLAADEVFQQRFRREAQVAAGLNEPHVVPIHDFGEIDGRLYVDMRLIDGSDLNTVLEGGPVEPARAVRIVEQIASALDAAHRTGLVHRDVKPSNILVTDDDFAYLIDFGIARAAGQTGLTHTGAVVGTWWYMAPERLTGGSADGRSDVYALACVLYECLTGQSPYPGDSLEEQVTGHLTVDPPKPHAVNPAVSAAFDEVIAHGMAKDPEQRYQTARELAGAAAEALSRPLIGAPPPAATTLVTPLPPAAATSPTSPHEPAAGVPLSRPLSHPSRRWKLIVLACGVSAAAVGLGIWGLGGDKSVPPAPHPPGSASGGLTPADVDLLKVMPPFGYNRANCTHQSPTMGADAVLACAKNTTVGAPGGRFFHFPNTNDLMAVYKSVTSIFHATNCPADPPGPDGPWSIAHTEVGRQACFADATVQPPAPSTVIATYNPAVMEIVGWTDPGGLDALAYWWRQGNATVQPAPGVDPDFFTADDLDLLKTLGATPYSSANCRHLDAPSPAKAGLTCAHNIPAGAPGAVFLAYPNRDAGLSWYSSAIKVIGPHRCGGSPGGPDDPWVHQGKPVGRYTCFADPTNGNLPSLTAVDSEVSFTGVQFVADPAGSPYQLPKTEAALADWFKKRFVS
jgi:predicted Ser/Thr protein kinase